MNHMLTFHKISRLHTKKKLAIIGIMTFMLLGIVGCMGGTEKNNEEMLAHMYEKYGVEFEICGYIPRNVDCSYDVWYCNAVNDEEKESIEVHRYYGELAEDGEYADTYYTRSVRDEVENRARNAILQVTDEVKAYLCKYDYAGEEYTKADQLDEYLQTKQGQYAFGMLIFVQDRESEGIMKEELLEKIQLSLSEAGIGEPRVRIFFVKTKEILDEINRENFTEIIYRREDEKIYTEDYSVAI